MSSLVCLQFLQINNTGGIVILVADGTQGKDRLISLIDRTFATSSELCLTFTMVIDHLLLEVISFFFVFGAFQLFLDDFGLHIEQGSVFDREVLVFLHYFCQFLLEILVDGIQVVEFFEKYEVLFVLLLQLFSHFEDGLPHDDLFFID